MDISNYLYLSVILFTIGATGVLVRRNAIVIFMCIELMLNAANLALVTFSRVAGNLEGQVASFFTMVVAACEVVVGLAIIVTIYRSRRSASVDAVTSVARICPHLSAILPRSSKSAEEKSGRAMR